MRSSKICVAGSQKRENRNNGEEICEYIVAEKLKNK